MFQWQASQFTSPHAGCFDGDLDLPLSLDADLESLLLGGTLLFPVE